MANQPIRAPLEQAIPPIPASLLEVPMPSQAPSEGACADSEEPGIYPEDPSPADETGNTDANGSPGTRAALATIRARERMHFLGMVPGPESRGCTGLGTARKGGAGQGAGGGRTGPVGATRPRTRRRPGPADGGIGRNRGTHGQREGRVEPRWRAKPARAQECSLGMVASEGSGKAPTGRSVQALQETATTGSRLLAPGGKGRRSSSPTHIRDTDQARSG